MIYTEEMREKLDAILKAFEGYIGGQKSFDIVYSEKAGYIYILVDPLHAGCAEQLDTPKKMLHALFTEFIGDVVLSPENTSHISDTHALTEWEEAESRRRITAILQTIEDGGAEYLNFLDAYIKDYQERCREVDSYAE